MERRELPRTALAKSVGIRPLCENIRFPVLTGKILDQSAGGWRIAMPELLAAGTPVEIQMDDEIVLAEVVWSANAGGGFCTGVKVFQALRGLAGIEALVQRLMPGEVALPVTTASL